MAGRCESILKGILSVIQRCHALFVVGFHSTIKLAFWDDRYHLVKLGMVNLPLGLPWVYQSAAALLHFLDLFGKAVSRHFQRDAASVGAANGMERGHESKFRTHGGPSYG